MKKAIGIVLVLIMMFSMIFTMPVSAAGGNLNITTESKTAKQGDTVSISVVVTSNSGYAILTVTPKYDSENLTLESKNIGSGFGGLTEGKNYVWNGNGNDITTTGRLVTFNFKVKDSAVVKDYEVGIDVRECTNASYEPLTVSAPKGTLKVGCKTHLFGNWYKIDNNSHKRTCSVCEDVETKAHTWNGGTVTKPADCKEVGNTHYTCTATGCGATKDVPISKTNNHTYGSWSQTSAPKCTTVGKEQRTCSTCQKVETRDIKATGHSLGSWTQTKAPSCETKGQETKSCSKCSYKETRDIAATGHKFSNPTVTKQPTCTETGIESGKCTRCNKETSNTIKATGHSFSGWVDTKAATCTEKGAQEHKCSKCNKVESRETDSLGHDFDKPVVIKEPTLTEKGIEEGVCKTCGEKTQAELPCVFKDETTGIEIKTDEGVFQEGTEIKIEVIDKEHTEFKKVKTALKEVGSKFVAFDVSAIRDNVVVQPNGTVTVSFKIPEGFGKNVAVFYISDDGISEKLESAISEDGKSISATLSHFSSYAVVELDAADTATNVDNDTDENSSNILWIIIAIIAVIIIAGAVIAIIFIKKKKANIVE